MKGIQGCKTHKIILFLDNVSFTYSLERHQIAHRASFFFSLALSRSVSASLVFILQITYITKYKIKLDQNAFVKKATTQKLRLYGCRSTPSGPHRDDCVAPVSLSGLCPANQKALPVVSHKALVLPEAWAPSRRLSRFSGFPSVCAILFAKLQHSPNFSAVFVLHCARSSDRSAEGPEDRVSMILNGFLAKVSCV